MLAEMEGKFDLFNLPLGWNNYKAESPNLVKIKSSEVVLWLIRFFQLPEPIIVESSQGGVTIYFISGEKKANVEFLTSGEMVATGADGQAWKVDHLPLALARIKSHFLE